MIRSMLVAVMLLSLAACGTSRNHSALQLMERQQEEQALLRQHEVQQTRAQAPDHNKLALQMIREAQREGRYFASLAYIDSYLLNARATPDILLLKANALRVTGNDAQAEGIYRDLIKTSHRAQAHHGLGLLAGQQGRYAEAIHELSVAVRLLPAQADILSDLGYALLRSGDVAAARLPLGQAAELEPENDKIISNLVLYLLLNNEHAHADRVRKQAGLSDTLFQSIVTLALQVRAESTVPVRTVVNDQGWVGHQPLLW